MLCLPEKGTQGTPVDLDQWETKEHPACRKKVDEFLGLYFGRHGLSTFIGLKSAANFTIKMQGDHFLGSAS
jgi:hypothetical protein